MNPHKSSEPHILNTTPFMDILKTNANIFLNNYLTSVSSTLDDITHSINLELGKKYEATVTQLKIQHQEQIDKLVNEHKKSLSDANDLHEKEMTTQTSSLKGFTLVQALSKQITDLRNELDMSNSRIKFLQKQLTNKNANDAPQHSTAHIQPSISLVKIIDTETKSSDVKNITNQSINKDMEVKLETPTPLPVPITLPIPILTIPMPTPIPLPIPLPEQLHSSSYVPVETKVNSSIQTQIKTDKSSTEAPITTKKVIALKTNKLSQTNNPKVETQKTDTTKMHSSDTNKKVETQKTDMMEVQSGDTNKKVETQKTDMMEVQSGDTNGKIVQTQPEEVILKEELPVGLTSDTPKEETNSPSSTLQDDPNMQ